MGQFDISFLSLLALRTVPALPSPRRIEFLTAEFIHEFFASASSLKQNTFHH
jgi:hypothetical protein